MTLGDVTILIFSVGAITIGCVRRTFYQATGTIYTSRSSKRAPTWLGRSMFIGVGLLILIPEIVHLFFN